ncbi:hypothetical protein N799_13415 [Lysobacter arseniciresistens ZS79]|uniref:Uncharacterized protein n=1 Tax=Lysobacter arseniciresistens ZS79 TaxID=913325 RepID=A0A0A0ER37_9GAMM|nr:hypothetical protein N799_13415 [Lysobacter arseniciresistens ZS79]
MPNQVPPVSIEQLREAIAFIAETHQQITDGAQNVFVWLWEAIQGDFNGERSTGQIVFDSAISMIPGVDQVCDVRDLIANCKLIEEDRSNKWAWVTLGLTLVGLIPVLGSLVKGVLKLFFNFVRRTGGAAIAKAVDEAMTWVITLLRKREVMKYWRGVLRSDHIFGDLSKLIKVVRGHVTLPALLRAFDRGIRLIRNLVEKVDNIPFVGGTARGYLEMVEAVRAAARNHMGAALRPLQDVLDHIIRRLDLEDLLQRGAIVDTRNVHFRGTLPEARAVTLMRTTEPSPSWLSKGAGPHEMLDPSDPGLQRRLALDYADGYPKLTPDNIGSFHKIEAHDIVGPARLYRITSPGNGAAGDCWISEDVFHNLMKSSDPKAAWRKHLAVWPDWNANGQFVVMEVPEGQVLKGWKGPASSQVKDKQLPGKHLEGGWEQIVIKPAGNEFDTTRYYMRGGGHGEKLHPPGLSREEFQRLSPAKQKAYTQIRQEINDPRIKGPYETGWGTTDFDPQLRDARIGLPALPGQITNAG